MAPYDWYRATQGATWHYITEPHHTQIINTKDLFNKQSTNQAEPPQPINPNHYTNQLLIRSTGVYSHNLTSGAQDTEIRV